jgi:cyclase
MNAIKIFNEKEVDELVMLDIGASKEKRHPNFALIQECASECFMPFAYGGGVSSLDDFAKLYRAGVEKVIVNTCCIRSPEIVAQAAREYGSTSIVGSVDYRKKQFRGQRVYSANAKTNRSVLEHCRFLADELGVGEILLQSVDRDGTWSGYDVATIREIAGALPIPVIAAGGAGSVAHVREVLDGTPANAAALGSMAVFQKQGMGVLVSFPRRSEVIDVDAELRANLN